MNSLNHFLGTYQKIDQHALHLLREIYDLEIVFTDPLHTIHGLERLESYFAGLYKNVDTVSFDFHHMMTQNDEAFIQWRMHLRHPRLAGGRPILVDGASLIRFTPEGKAVYHRDYFDVGSMIYEHIPLLGKMIAKIKSKAAP